MNAFTLWAVSPGVPSTSLTLNWHDYVANGRTDIWPFTDDKCLVSVHGHMSYDDGYGPLWIHRDSMGISGIVRAQTFEDAYGICEDEFLPEADDTVAQMELDYSTVYMSGRELYMHETGKDWQALTDGERTVWWNKSGKDVPYEGELYDHPCWQEAYGFRPNGANATDKLRHGIYAKDMNGDHLERLTPELAERLELVFVIEIEQPF